MSASTLYYRVAIVTGLRCGELAALRVSQLDVTNNCLRADAETTKNRKSAIIPLPADLTASLAEVKLQKPAGDLLLTMPAHSDVFFKRDAENAGIVLEQPEGRATFHSLRKSTATILSEHAGASLPETQKLMRHSTPTLTSNTYTKTSGSRQTALVESLGRLLA